jgi:iron complex outermembrane receptor protein
MTTELYVFGGPMKLHLTYLGADRMSLETNRRYNPLTYEHETDNFSQPHYHLHNALKLSEVMTLFNTLYFIRGEGFYEQQRLGVSYADYNIDTSQTGGNQTGDLITQQQVSKYQIGWNPRLEIKHDRGTHTVGGSAYYFESDHWGEVIWAQNITGQLDSRHKYYQYYGEKIVGSVYGEEFYRLNDRLSTQVTGQLRWQRYNFNQDRLGLFKGFDYQLDWIFLSPRVGFNYQVLNEAERQVNVYTNFAISSRTATDAAIYDASDPYVFPSIEIESITVTPSGDSVYNFGEPTFESERVYDLELGGNYRTSKYSAGLNLFWMNFSDEIIPYGGINPSNGQITTVNAEGSYRAGVELQGEVKATSQLKFSGNLSLNRYRIKDFSGAIPVYDSAFNYVGDTTVEFSDVTGLAFPEVLGNFIADYNPNNWRFTYRLRFAGKQYMELLNLEGYAIESFAVSSVGASYTFSNFLNMGDLTIIATMDNIFDQEYEVSGYGWNYGMTDGSTISLTGGAEYYVAAERSWFGQVKLTLF